VTPLTLRDYDILKSGGTLFTDPSSSLGPPLAGDPPALLPKNNDDAPPPKKDLSAIDKKLWGKNSALF